MRSDKLAGSRLGARIATGRPRASWKLFEPLPWPTRSGVGKCLLLRKLDRPTDSKPPNSRLVHNLSGCVSLLVLQQRSGKQPPKPCVAGSIPAGGHETCCVPGGHRRAEEGRATWAVPSWHQKAANSPPRLDQAPDRAGFSCLSEPVATKCVSCRRTSVCRTTP